MHAAATIMDTLSPPRTRSAFEDATPAVRQRPITVDEYHRMTEAGVLREDERIELLDGRLIAMTAVGPSHIHCVNRLTELLAERLYTQPLRQARLSIQNPLRLSDTSEPEPDVVLLDSDMPQDRVPTSGDAFLVVEVGDSSTGYDRSVKAPRYAEAGVPVYWVVDLGAQVVDVLWEPDASLYAQRKRYRSGDTVPLSDMLDATPISVDAILHLDAPEDTSQG